MSTKIPYSPNNAITSATLSSVTISGATIADGTNIVINTTTGTKIGTAASQKIGFWNAAPVVQPTTIADIDAGTVNSGDAATDTVITDMRTKFNSLLSKLETIGLLASA